MVDRWGWWINEVCTYVHKHLRTCWIMTTLRNVTIIIACSNLLNLGFFTHFVLSWCVLVDKLNTHVVNRTSSLEFELKTRMAVAFKCTSFVVFTKCKD